MMSLNLLLCILTLTILEKHAPLKKRTVSLGPSSQRYTDEIKSTAKTMRRKLERKWRSNKSKDNRKRYVD